MAEIKAFNDQSLIRAIRQAVSRFNSAADDDINAKLKAIMEVAALGAVGTVSNRQMSLSTISYIQSALH